MKTYNIFISHSWAYSGFYDGLINFLDNARYFSYNDHSVPIYDPIHTKGTDKELYEAIYKKMQGCHVVLISTGVYSTYSKWINKEIKIAREGFITGSKPIIGINPWGQKNISSVVEEHAVKTVGWRSDSIIDAIKNHSL
jgi:hypothetical protein